MNADARPIEDVPFELWCEVGRGGELLPHEWLPLGETESACRYCRSVVEL